MSPVIRQAWWRARKAASTSRERYAGHLRRDFLAGLLIMVPLAATILILKWLFESIDGILAPAVDAAFGRHIPGIGFGVILVVVYLAGLVTRHFLGSKIIQRVESLPGGVPVVREIHSTIKQILESVMLPHEGAFKEVVLVEFPRPGMRTIGFITNRLHDSSGQELVNVYIPTTPNPTSGYLEIVPEDDVVYLDMQVDEAIKMVVSGGTVSPEVLHSVKREKRGGFTPAASMHPSKGLTSHDESVSEPDESSLNLRTKRKHSKKASTVR